MAEKRSLEHRVLHLLSNSYTLMLMNQDVHWNYSGPDFYALHQMTQAHYEALFAIIDEVAEHMRTNHWSVPVGLDVFYKHSDVVYAQHTMASRNAYLKSLIEAYGVVLQEIHSTQLAAQQAQDANTEDLCVDIHRRLSMHLWMLKSSLDT